MAGMAGRPGGWAGSRGLGTYHCGPGGDAVGTDDGVVGVEGAGAVVDFLALGGVTGGGLLDLEGVGAFLGHGDDGGGQVGPGDGQVGGEVTAGAAGGAFDVGAVEGDDVQVAHRAQAGGA
jgi:hypothetical protein